MTTRFIAMLLAAVLAAAGVLTLTESRTGEQAGGKGPLARTALAADPEPFNDAYIGDFKSGYGEGFTAGVAGLGYPDQASMTSNTRGFLDGYSQGYTEGQGQQSNLRSQLCRAATTAAFTSGPVVYSGSGYSARTSNLRSTRTLGDRAYYNNDDYTYRPAEQSRGIGSTARKALLIAGGAAAGAGLGGAFGGKKGALIGAALGGGTGTVLALKNRPRRAFNRGVSKKSVLTKTLIGAGAGAAIGALTGGKRGAFAGAALGGGGGALWSLLSGKRTRRY